MSENPVLELRIYTVSPGRRADFDRRIREVAIPLLRSLGFRLLGYWEDVADTNTIVYGLNWKDEAEMAEAWAAFGATPEWQAARVEYDRPGPLLAGIQKHVIRPTIAGPFAAPGTASALSYDCSSL